MKKLIFKYISQSAPQAFAIIQKSGFTFKEKKHLYQLKKSTLSKNKTKFKMIEQVIKNYESTNKSNLKFSNLTLWEIADAPYQLPTLLKVVHNSTELLKIFEDVNDIVYVSRRKGACKVFELLLNTMRRNTLIDRIQSQGLMKIMRKNGASQPLNLILDDNAFYPLKNLIGIENIIDISSHDGGKQVLDLILDDASYTKLIELLGKDNFLKIANKSGSRQTFDLFLKDNSFQKLAERIGKDFVIQIAMHMGSRPVFDIILDDKKYAQLLEQFGKNLPLLISTGTRPVFDILLNKESYKILLERLGKSLLIKIARHNGSKKVLETILDTPSYTTLVERLGKENLLKISNRDGSKKVFDIVLNKTDYETLIGYLGKNNFVKMASYMFGSRKIFDLLLDPKTYKNLTSQLGQEAVGNIAKYRGARSVLELILKKNSFSLLLSRLGKDLFLKIACQDNAITALNLIVDTERWNILNQFFSKKNLIKLSQDKYLKFSLEYMVTRHKELSKYFSKESIYKYTLIPNKNQKGLTDTALNYLFNSLHFKEEEVLILTKISGRFFQHILELLQHHESEICKFFEENGENFLPSYSLNSSMNNHASLKHLNQRALWFIALVEYNKFCIDDPLTMDELFFLKKITLTNGSVETFFTHKQRLLKLTGRFPSADRKKIWPKMIGTDFIDSDYWYFKLRTIASPEVLLWYIEKGEFYIRSILNMQQSETHKLTQCGDLRFRLLLNTQRSETHKLTDNFNQKDQLLFMHCLQNYKIRAHIAERYEEELKSFTDYPANRYLTNEINYQFCVISTPFGSSLQLIDWLRIVMIIYNFIDTERRKLDVSEKGDDKLEPPSTPSHELKLNYPEIVFKDNSIHVNIGKNLLDTILFSASEQNISPPPPKKRRKTVPYNTSQAILSPLLPTDINYQEMLFEDKDFQFDFCTLLENFKWDQLEDPEIPAIPSLDYLSSSENDDQD